MRFDSISQSEEPDFKLADWWVYPQRNELERGGDVAHVEARSMGVLVCLARHAPRVVTRERLLKEVWSDAPFVGEEVLSHAIWELRKTLGDSARKPRYVQTIPRKGYRLVAEVVSAKGSPLPLAGVQINHYDIQEEIGRGAMGVVYKAVDRRLDRPVAIKFLAPELTRDTAACQRFEREARLAAALDHPHLATVLEIGETSEGHRYLVTPLYRGGSLKERLARGPVPVQDAIGLVRQLAAGLGAAHRRGIVHRDVKPANLLLDEHGTLKIADFGIAKLLGATELTRTGVVLGTPAYKSPEQSRGEAVDQRSDLWAVGVVLCELLTGRRPFDGEYDQAVVHAILSYEPEVVADAYGRPLPEALRRIVANAMAKNPAERYQDAEELCRDLDRIGEEGPRARPRWRRWAAGIGAALAALVLALAIFVIRWGGSSREASPSEDPVRIEAEARLEQGQRLWLRGDLAANLEDAGGQLERAVTLAPNWAEALAVLAVFKAELYGHRRDEADRAEARELIERARAADPETPLAWVAEARLLLLERQYAEAEAAARVALEREPACASCDLAYVWLGEALWQQGRREEATEILKRGEKVGGSRIRSPLKLAQLYALDGQTSKAAVEYQRVLEWDADQTTALNDLGNLYLATNQYEKAAGCLRALFRKTQDPKAAVNLGHALYGQKRWQEAIEFYQQADQLFEALDEIVPTPAVSLGDVYLEQGKRREATDWYARALVKFDELMERPNPGARRRAQRAVCLAKLGRFDDAEQEIRALLPEWKEFPNVLFYSARIYALKNDRPELFDMARRAIEAGCSPHRLVDDAAFIPYREDPDYLRLLEPQVMPER